MTAIELKHQANLQRWAQAIQDCRSSGVPVKGWRVLNLAYRLGYKRNHSGDCDLNNADEGKNIFNFIGR